MDNLLTQLDKVKRSSTKADKRKLLKSQDSPALRQLLFIALSPTEYTGLVDLDFNDDPLPYDPEPATLGNFLLLIRAIRGSDQGHKEPGLVEQVEAYIQTVQPALRELLVAVFTGTLTLGLDPLQINEPLPGCIPTLSVSKPVPFLKGQVPYPLYASPILNGLRVVAVVTKQGARLFALSGKPITSLPHVLARVKRLPPGYYDGLLRHDQWTTRSTMALVRSERPRGDYHAVYFQVNDWVSAREWEKPVTDAKVRFAQLNQIMESHTDTSLRWVPPERIERNFELLRLHRRYLALGHEGTLIRSGGEYRRWEGWHMQVLRGE